MTKKQTRRTIGFNAALYDRASEVAAERGITLTRLAEIAVAKETGMDLPPVADRANGPKMVIVSDKNRKEILRLANLGAHPHAIACHLELKTNVVNAVLVKDGFS